MEQFKRDLPLPIDVQRLGRGYGLISSHDELVKALPDLLPNVTEHEVDRIGSHLADLIESLTKGRGHLPKDVVPTPGKGDMTHILNGRLLRRQGIWIGLHFDEDAGTVPLSIVSINRGDEQHLHSLLSGPKTIGRKISWLHAKKYGQGPTRKFH